MAGGKQVHAILASCFADLTRNGEISLAEHLLFFSNDDSRPRLFVFIPACSAHWDWLISIINGSLFTYTDAHIPAPLLLQFEHGEPLSQRTFLCLQASHWEVASAQV